MDFFTVPTATFRVLSLFVVLSHARRRIVHFAVMEHPVAGVDDPATSGSVSLEPGTAIETGYVERLAGSLRRECLHHIIVWTQRPLRRILRDYFAYCEHAPSVAQGCARTESCGEAGARPHRIHCSSRRLAPIATGDKPLRAKTGQHLSAVGISLSLPSKLHFRTEQIYSMRPAFIGAQPQAQ
jgi:hypothetical protein